MVRVRDLNKAWPGWLISTPEYLGPYLRRYEDEGVGGVTQQLGLEVSGVLFTNMSSN